MQAMMVSGGFGMETRNVVNKKQQFQMERMVDFMKEDRLKKYLDELSEGTDFDFRIYGYQRGY